MTPEYHTHCEVDLAQAQCFATGKTHHSKGAKALPATRVLRIVQVRYEAGFYLLHLDAQGNEITDTLHDTIEDAMDQAGWEFGVRPEQWHEPLGRATSDTVMGGGE